MRNLYLISLIFTILGSLVWGLIGFLGFDLIVMLFGTSMLTKVVHVVFGISAAYMLYHTITNFETLTKTPE